MKTSISNESDYLLFIDNKAIAVVEAKREENDLGDEVELQAENYAVTPENWYGMKILHINTDIVLPKFAFYLMQATEIDHDNHQRYWISTYSQEEIALPPLKEQERILSVLEQYFKLLNCLL